MSSIRDALASTEYWNKWIPFFEDNIANDIKTIAQPSKNPGYRPQYVRDLAFFHLHLLLSRYSRGDAIADLSQYFEPLLIYWEESERLGKAVWTVAEHRMRYTWAINLGHYIDSFWLIGLALAFDIPDDQWRRLLKLIGNEGQDLLLDSIIATRQVDRKIGTSLCYPKPYVRLHKAVVATKSEQAKLLNSFVENWYQELGKATRSSREKQVTGNKEPDWYTYHSPMKGAYFGFWCLEAIAAVKAFGLDDSLCIGHPHYPGDLIRPGSVTLANTSRLPPELAETMERVPSISEAPMQATGLWDSIKLIVNKRLRG